MPTAEQTKTVRVSAAASPFSARRTVCEFPEHTTVRQIVAKLRANLRGLRVNVLSKGRIISKRHWDRPIKGGELIEIRIVLAGGGGDGGKGGLQGALQNFLRFYAEKMPVTPLGFSTRMMTSFAGGITGGVAPPPEADLGNLSGTAERHSETLFLRGTRNQSRPFSAIPRVLGRHKIVPAYAMEPYTIDKDEQFMRVLFDLGYGMLLIDDIKIGDTPIYSFSEVEYETRFGSDDDPAITLIRDQVREEDLAVKLNEDEDVIRTTEPDTDAISVDFHWPRGLVHVEDDGEYDEIETRIRIQYALAGKNKWKNAPDQDDLEDGVAEIEGSSTKPIVKNFQWNVPRGQYDVKITRLNQEAPDDDEEEADRYFEDVYWIKLRSERRAAPITRTGTARIAISIQASEQLNNVVVELSCVVWSVVPDLGAHQIRFDGYSEHLR
ncbi:MAG TPA: hypothetical protein PLG31_19610, partial [Spirochaetota bacterium]|nr:hypothetical protein [Spirochaetota bacterium]